TLLDLAELYTAIGAKRRAIKKCEAILYFAPEDGRALALLQKAQQMPEHRREDVEDLVKTYADQKRKGAQRRGRKPGESLGPSQRLAKNPELLQKKLATLRPLPGFAAAVAMDQAGAAVVGYSTRAADYSGIAATLNHIF